MPIRKIFLALLALVSAGLAGWVLIAALVADELSGQVFFAVMPLAMLFGIAWNGLSSHKDD